jgi:hypothetical protein
MKYAPIALFVYNRPKHLKKTLNSLKKNPETRMSTIYIFSDSFKSKDLLNKKKVEEVRVIIKKINFFKKKIIIERKKNIGLKKNILTGISLVLKKYSNIIVLEDDLVVSESFLKYMNESLKKFKNLKKIWHISAWNYDIKENNYDKDAFFIRNMNCWGWGTWKDRWIKLNTNSKFYIKKFSNKDKYKFNLEGSFENFSQIIRNHNKTISTWAIFWNATIFLNNGLCLNPIKSLTLNIGQDLSGTNTVNPQLSNRRLNNNKKFILPSNTIEDFKIRKRIINHLKRKKNNFLNKILRYF